MSLEKIANAVIIMVCVVALYALVDQTIAMKSKQISTTNIIGKPIKLSSLRGVHAKPLTVVLAMSSTCHYCLDSLPLYEKISQGRKNTGGSRFDFVVVSPEPTGQMAKFLADHHIEADQVLQAPPTSIGVLGTPSILLVDSGGVVRRVFAGKLAASKEAELEGAIRSDASLN